MTAATPRTQTTAIKKLITSPGIAVSSELVGTGGTIVTTVTVGRRHPDRARILDDLQSAGFRVADAETFLQISSRSVD